MPDFYVSPSGSDANAGTSAAAPWQTVAKVNSVRNTLLTPGSRVFFEGGQKVVWGAATYLMPSGQATLAGPITYGIYGNGRAIFEGNPGGGLIYQDNTDYVVIEDFLFRSTSVWDNAGISPAAGLSGCPNWTVRRCRFEDLGLAINTNNVADDNWVVEDCEMINCGDSAMLVAGDNWIIRDNVMKDIGVDPSVSYGTHGVYLKGSGHEIRRNIVENCEDGQGVSQRGYNNVIEENYFKNCAGGIGYFANHATRGTSRWAYNRIDVDQPGIGAYAFYGVGDETHFNENFIIIHNSIRLLDSGTPIHFDISDDLGTGPAANANTLTLRIKNNIIQSSAVAAYMLNISHAMPGTWDEDYNIWWENSGAMQFALYDIATYTSFASFKAGQGGDHDFGADPRFLTTLGLNPLSPAIDAGIMPITGAPTYEQDDDGAPFHYYGSAPDIGAMEFIPVPPPVAPEVASITPPYGLEAATFEYNGIFLHRRGEDSRYRVIDIGGFDDAEWRDSREVNPGEHGETPYALLAGGRTLTFTGRFEAPTILEIRRMQYELRTAMLSLVELPLYVRMYGTGRDVFIRCRKGAPYASRESQPDLNIRRDFQITMRASDPRFYSVEEQVVSFQPSSVGELARVYPRTYPLQYNHHIDSRGYLVDAPEIFVVTNIGNFESYPIIEMKGLMEGFSMVNLLTNAEMSLDEEIPAGDTWTYDVLNGTLLDQNGESHFDALSAVSEDPVIARGDNYFVVTVSDFDADALVTVRSRHAWM